MSAQRRPAEEPLVSSHRHGADLEVVPAKMRFTGHHAAAAQDRAGDHAWRGRRSVTLGEFLGREDQLRLIELLRGELRVRACSRRTQLPF